MAATCTCMQGLHAGHWQGRGDGCVAGKTGGSTGNTGYGLKAGVGGMKKISVSVLGDGVRVWNVSVEQLRSRHRQACGCGAREMGVKTPQAAGSQRSGMRGTPRTACVEHADAVVAGIPGKAARASSAPRSASVPGRGARQPAAASAGVFLGWGRRRGGECCE
jgi:hypothetical protein